MPNYLVTYHGAGPLPSSPAAMEQMQAAFLAWVESVGDHMVDPGAPLGRSKTVTADAVREGHGDGAVEGYTVLKADTIDDAVALVRGHPFLTRGEMLGVSEAVTLP